ncbi:unnamed protein product [Prunus brigantina]
MNGSCLQSITTPRKACKNIEIRVLEKRSRLDRTCMQAWLGLISIWSREAWWSFGVVKHGGVTPMNLGKSRPPL